MKRFLKRLTLTALIILGVGFLIPQNLKMPVVGADSNSYNHNTFWHGGWGSSVVHKGVDVFAKKGTSVHSATKGIVLATSEGNKSGKFVTVLGPKWRIHEYLHLNTIEVDPFEFVKPGERIATLGKSGNAASTPAHVHYGIITPIPYVWRAFGTAGTCNPPKRFNWRLMFWLDPADHLPTE